MYKMIMAPTDGSGFDREAIRVALRIAERSQVQSRLHLRARSRRQLQRWRNVLVRRSR